LEARFTFPAEAAAGHLGMQANLTRIDTQSAGYCSEVDRLQLRSAVDVDRSVIRLDHHRIERLHRRVGEIGEDVFLSSVCAASL
jgi:hypothetical protein